MDSSWGNYCVIDGAEFSRRDWRETIDGGQAFTWFETDTPDEYCGVFSGVAARVRLDESGKLRAAFPKHADQKKCACALAEYLDTKTDYRLIRTALENSGDENMRKALQLYPTLRILRQNPAEAIIGFICSSSKRIVQIKQCVRLLSEKFGEEIGCGLHALPTFETLANADLDAILACKLGFRAKYLLDTARKITADNFDPIELREMDYPCAKKYLTSLSGVGEKVADCILLFGCSRLEAFPVDTWIKQAMHDLYTTGHDPKKIRQFAAQKFPHYAGFAQQLLFAAKRNNFI